MGLPTSLTLASLPSLSLSQVGTSARSGILGVYPCKVARSSCIQNYFQHIEIYVLFVVHTYNIEPFTSKVKRFGQKDSPNFLHNSPVFGCVAHKRGKRFKRCVSVQAVRLCGLHA